MLGRYYMQRLNYSKAYEAYQQAVYRDSRNSNFWCSIGVLYWEINQFRDALDAYTRAIRLNPYIPEIWFNLGTLYEACNNQIQDAIDAYNRAYEIDSSIYAVEERLAILKRNLETGRNDGPPPPRPSDIDPQRYEDFLQSQANQQNVAQLQGMTQSQSQSQWGGMSGSTGGPPPPQHRPMHQQQPPQHTQYPPRRSPDQMKTATYSHPPPSGYSNGNSGYGRPPPGPPVTIKRGTSPPPYGYDGRPPMEPQHQGYPRHDDMPPRPAHGPQNYVSPRQHEREIGGSGGHGGHIPHQHHDRRSLTHIVGVALLLPLPPHSLNMEFHRMSNQSWTKVLLFLPVILITYNLLPSKQTDHLNPIFLLSHEMISQHIHLQANQP